MPLAPFAQSFEPQEAAAQIHDCPCHIDFTKDGRWALTAAYMDGTVAVWPIDPATGELGACTDTKKQCLRDPNPSLADRQEQAHAHQVLLDPFQNKWALVCDLGTDMVYVYELDARRGSLSGASDAARHLRLKEGSGPRHLDYHPSGRYVYITCELSGEVVCAAFDQASGTLSQLSAVNALPDGVTCCRKGTCKIVERACEEGEG